jgi:hypothetical protein
MQNATKQELDQGLAAAYDRAFALRKQLKHSATLAEFKKHKLDLDHVLRDIADIEAEIQCRRELAEGSVPV